MLDSVPFSGYCRAMAIIRATAVINKRSGKPEDASRNVWHFSADGTDATTLSKIGEGLAAFYDGCKTILSPAIAATVDAHRVELAEVGFGSVSPLLATRPFTIGIVATGNVPLPNEAACALSFRASIVGIPEEEGLQRPRSRRRGRIFLGPLNGTSVEAQATTWEPQVTTVARETILDSYDNAHNVWIVPATNIRHGVLSRVDGNLRIVEQVSVDDEFDTIRRRGQKPGVRMARSVTPGSNVSARSGVDVVLAS